MSEVDAKPPQENPLVNILINVVVPVLALSYLSKDPNLPEAKAWHVGPHWAMGLALALPIGYGIWFFLQHRKFNLFSVIGLGSVLLTGGLTIYLWNADGTIKPHAAQLFGIKEASIPLALGVAILLSHWSKSPLLNAFLYNPQVFDLKRIESKVKEREAETAYARLLFQCTLIFAGSFLFSTVLNFFLAQFFLGGIDTKAPDAFEQYNAGVAKLTGWGFAVIGVPILILLIFLFWFLIRGLKKITALTTEEILLPK